MTQAKRSILQPAPQPLQKLPLPDCIHKHLEGLHPPKLEFSLQELEELAAGGGRRLIDDPGYGAQRIGFGEYLESLLVHLAWWMAIANYATLEVVHERRGPRSPSDEGWYEEEELNTRELSQVRLVLTEVLANIPTAWGQTYMQSADRSDTIAAARVLARYFEFRGLVCGLAKRAWPGFDLQEIEKHV